MTGRKKTVTRNKSGGRKKTSSKSAAGSKGSKAKSVSSAKEKAIKDFGKVLKDLEEVADDSDAWDTATQIRKKMTDGKYIEASQMLEQMATDMPELTHDWAWLEDYQPISEAKRVGSNLLTYDKGKSKPKIISESLSMAEQIGNLVDEPMFTEEVIKHIDEKNYAAAAKLIDSYAESLSDEIGLQNFGASSAFTNEAKQIASDLRSLDPTSIIRVVKEEHGKVTVNIRGRDYTLYSKHNTQYQASKRAEWLIDETQGLSDIVVEPLPEELRTDEETFGVFSTIKRK